jgi:sugar phosphate isomerase/epimerase
MRSISRRNFIGRATHAAALLAATKKVAGTFPGKVPATFDDDRAASEAGGQTPRTAAGGMYVSLNGSLTRQMPWTDFARLAGKLGYGGVDVNLGSAKTDGVDATRALLKELNLKPAVANLGLQFITPDDAAFQQGLKQLDENAKFAAAIGLHRMMAVLSPASPVPKDERRTFVKDRVTAIAQVLQRSNIRFGLEFLGPLYMRSNAKSPHPFIWTLTETAALAQECGPNIGVVLDAWHWHHSGGTTADILAAGKSRIVHIHVSDAKPQPPDEVRDNHRHMPGEGIIDLVGFFQALKKIGYEDGISPEPLGRIPENMTPEEGARLGLETTLAMMKKAGVV